MTDLTTRTHEHGIDPTPTLPEPAPVNGAALGDRRTLRLASRAEQQRLSADAEVERRARAAHLELELREKRWTAARRARQANQQEQQARAEQRQVRRAARHARLRAAASRWANTTLFILPILFPMAVAWIGQIRFAMDVMHWPLPAAIVFAAGFELSTAYAARLDWLSRAAGDSALLFRAATWGFASGAALMNYWHAAGPHFAPTGAAVSYGLMSITGVVLWELLSTYRHRTALRAEGKLPPARPRYGLARWIWFSPLTHLAWLLALRDGHTTTEHAWQAAITATEHFGSPRAARSAIRAGHRVPQQESLPNHDPDGPDNATNIPPCDEGPRDARAGHTDTEVTSRYLNRDGQKRDTQQHDTNRDTQRRLGDRDNKTRRDITKRYEERDTATPGNQRDTGDLWGTAVQITAPARETTGEHHNHGHAAPIDPADATKQSTPVRENAAASAGDGDRPGALPSGGKGAVIARMRVYARECVAQGNAVTGADLDRQFGTRDYGRKVLRQLAAESTRPA